MKLVEKTEILGLGEYEAIRDRFRARVIDEKKRRRVRLGDRMSCVFENRDTVLWQIQEMLRTERITKPSAIAHEIETYNTLVPGEYELSATVMVEIDDKTERDRFLTEGAGLQEHVYLAVDGERAPASWDAARVEEGRLSAVLYLKFPLGPARAERLRSGKALVELGVEHPACTAKTTLPAVTIESLAEDLA